MKKRKDKKTFLQRAQETLGPFWELIKFFFGASVLIAVFAW